MTQKHVPLSVNIIHKGPAENLVATLDSVYGAIFKEGDEAIIVDTGSKPTELTKIRKKLKKFPGARLVLRPDLSKDYRPLIEKFFGSTELATEYKNFIGQPCGLLDFAEARQVAMDESSNDIIFWIDSDDVLAEAQPGQLRGVVDQVFESGQFGALFLDYEYAFAEDGTCTTILRRERFVDKRLYYWKGRCHETLIPRPGTDAKRVAMFENVRSVVRHTEARKPHRISDIRNYVILRNEYEEEGSKVDPRTVFYLGNACRGLARFKEALQYYRMFDGASGSEDDRFATWYYIASIYLDPRVRRPHEAMDAYLECCKIKPQDPRGHFGKQRAALQLYRFEESVQYYRDGLRFEMPRDQLFSYDPTHINYHPHLLAVAAYKELEQPEKALESAMMALNSRPDNSEAKGILEGAKNWALGIKIKRSALQLAQATGDNAAAGRMIRNIMKELPAVPEELERSGFGKIEPPEARDPRPDLAIFCPSAAEQWGPHSRKKGIGGSEKMVIMLAEQLQSTGKVNVTVYCDIPNDQRGIHQTGVAWYHWSQFDLQRERNAIAFWRCPEWAVRLGAPARFRFAWNHDVQNPVKYSEEVLAALDLVQLQSEYHSEPLKGTVPPEQLWIARNATELPVKTKNPVARNPKQVFYCSSWDRGVLTAAEIVRRAQKIDPEIHLVVTYGISEWARRHYAKRSHGHCPDVGRDISMDLFEREANKALDAVNATVLHRINFEKMSALMQTSGTWLYPTRFPEISCMSAMEAQLHGCVPVCTLFGALGETVLPSARKFGTILPAVGQGAATEEFLDKAAEALVRAASVPSEDPRRQKMASDAFKAYDVGALAEDWLSKILPVEDSEQAAGVSPQAASVQPAGN